MASRNLANSNSGKAIGNGAAKIVQPALPASNGSAAAATSNGNANSTNNSPAPAANASATPDSAANAGTDTASNAAVATALNAAISPSGGAAASGATPGASKTPGGKDDPNNQNNDAADPASDLSTAKPAELASLDAAQPVAVAISGNATANAAPAIAKTASAVADVLTGRAKATPASAPASKNTPVQASDTDPAASVSTTDSGGADGSTSAALDATTGDNSAPTTSAQQTPGQPGAAAAALLTQIDFVSSGGAERLGVHTEATALNGAAVSATPAASANASIAPNFGVFAANATTNGSAPAAAGSDTPVPVAGLAVAIAARAQGGSSQFDIRLDPPELGRIDVRLGVDGSGQVTTHVTVDRADTLQLLQSQQPQLQQALEQAGLKTADNGLQFTLRDQSFAGQNGGSGGQQQPAPPPQLVIPQSDVAPIDTAQIYARLRSGNGLDIRV
jgi:flagellar hook-length control protein FliK